MQKLKNNPSLLFIGLGNPGLVYHETRHNAGFMVIDKLVDKLSFKYKNPFFKNYLVAQGLFQNQQIVIIKPMTFMNNSGLIFNYLPGKYINNNTKVVVVSDNMDLSLGECRIKNKGSNSSHNGMSSIINSYGSGDFLRVYVGVSKPAEGETVISHVLGKCEESDFLVFQKGIERASNAAYSLITHDVQRVMNEYNRRNN